MSETVKKVVIIGAGPAGLTAAYRLLQHPGYEVTVLEESSKIGGLSRTERHRGNRMDIGGHRFFSKSDEVNRLWEELLPRQETPERKGPDPQTSDDVMLVRHRLSRIYYRKRFFDYPVSLKLSTILNLGIRQTFLVGVSYLGCLFHKRRERSLEDFYINRFGRRLYQMFFECYTEKLWGVHPRAIAPDWGAQRVKGLSLTKALFTLLLKPFHRKNAKVETSLIETFLYPKFGPGQLWETMAEKVKQRGGTVLPDRRVTGIELENGRIVRVAARDSGGTEYRFHCDLAFSSMPVKDLVAALSPAAPPAVRKIAANLPYRDFITVGLLLKKLSVKSKPDLRIVPDCWIYVQEPDVRLGRIQVFNNWSPYLVADVDHTVWLGLEYFCTENDAMWNMPEAEFTAMAAAELEKIGIIDRNDILDSVKIKVKKAYPAYFGSYAQFGEVRAFLDAIPNLFCIGRNGQHRYNNMDHSMLTAIAAVRQAVAGSNDKTPVWSVNTEENYHEAN